MEIRPITHQSHSDPAVLLSAARIVTCFEHW
jgi:hypothetical protein